MEKNIFISHSCKDHYLTDYMVHNLEKNDYIITIDPFEPGEKTCIKIQDCIKKCSHFILLLTINSFSSYWVRMESLFAQLCYKENALNFIPISFNDTPLLETASEFICIKWKDTKNLDNLITILIKIINNTHQKKILDLDVDKSNEIKEKGRNFEKLEARTGDILFLHKAVGMYEKAIKLNYCNHNAWANLSWSLWKLREDNRAWKYIGIAEDISENSNHVKDVKERMVAGKRSII